MIARAITVHDHTWWKWLAAGWALMLFASYGPAAERYLFPVVSHFEIVQIDPDGVGSRVYVRFEKYRRCEYLGMTWSQIMPDGTMQRAFLNLKPADDMTSPTRPVGEQIAGPWYVGMSPDQIKNHSRVTLSYRCHPLWLTEADAWP
jgi:hypothetical protein